MKKLLTVIFTLCTVMPVAMAQYTYGDPVPAAPGNGTTVTRFGLFISPNNSWMKPTASKSNDGLYTVTNGGSKIGFTWGLMIDKFFAPNYGISTGVQLNTTGGSINALYNGTVTGFPAPSALVTSADFDYRLQYLEVPFGLKLLSDKLPGGIRVFGNVGITGGINISKKASYTVTYFDTAGNQKTITGDNEKLRGPLSITPLLFQMNLGGGIEYQFTDKLSFYLGLFFNNGFAPDVTNPKEINMNYDGNFTDGNIRLNNLGLKLGMFF